MVLPTHRGSLSSSATLPQQQGFSEIWSSYTLPSNNRYKLWVWVCTFCSDHLNPVPIPRFLPFAGSSMKTLWPWRISMRAPPTTTWSCSCKWRWPSPLPSHIQRPSRGGEGENSCQIKSRTRLRGSEMLSFWITVLPVQGWGVTVAGCWVGSASTGLQLLGVSYQQTVGVHTLCSP